MFKPQNAPREADRRIARIPMARIAPNPDQPRQTMDPEAIGKLAESIRRHGQLTPILVRTEGNGYALIAGQRRMSAMALLGRSHIEAIVLSSGDCDSALIALVENMQREALHFLDEAEACRRILEAHPITQEKLAASLSMSPSALANRLRLLKLSQPVREAVRRHGLTERHARALLRVEDADAQLALANRAGERRMSVKQLEAAVAQAARPRAPRPVVSRAVRDNRIIINAVMDTVKELKRIGVQVGSRVEERGDHIDVVVTIPKDPSPGSG